MGPDLDAHYVASYDPTVKRFVVRGRVTLDVSTMVVEADDQDGAVDEAVCALVAERIRGMGYPTDMIVEATAMRAREIPSRQT